METSEQTKPAGLDVKNPFTSVPIEITVSVGKARPLIRDLVTLGENAVLTLESPAINDSFRSNDLRCGFL